MSRYIDAEWLCDELGDINMDIYTDEVKEYIDSAPSIDIVRCGECKYWNSAVQMPNGTEVKCLYGRKPDDFCSYGERSEKPNNCETCKWWEGNTNFCYSKADSDDHACHYEPKDKWREERSSE